MKKLLFYFLTVALVVSCNNDKTADAAGTSKLSETSTPVPSSATIDCSSFVWFKKGTTLEYKTTTGAGKTIVAATSTTIDDVHQDGAALVADYTSSFKDKKIRSSYRCENGVLYIDMKSLFQDLFSGLKERGGVEIEVKEGYLSYPWSLKEGDDLKDADFVLTSKQNGKEFMTMRSQIKNRKVAGAEKITTPAGTWDCLKLNESRVITMSMMGKQMSAKEHKTSVWFAPGAGLVKTETYDEKGELVNATELQAITSGITN